MLYITNFSDFTIKFLLPGMNLSSFISYSCRHFEASLTYVSFFSVILLPLMQPIIFFSLYHYCTMYMIHLSLRYVAYVLVIYLCVYLPTPLGAVLKAILLKIHICKRLIHPSLCTQCLALYLTQ